MARDGSIFLLPRDDSTLLYAPLHGTVTLLEGRLQPDDRGRVEAVLRRLGLGAAPEPARRTGPLSPGLLGLITTRGCNLACSYCAFAGSSARRDRMP